MKPFSDFHLMILNRRQLVWWVRTSSNECEWVQLISALILYCLIAAFIVVYLLIYIGISSLAAEASLSPSSSICWFYSKPSPLLIQLQPGVSKCWSVCALLVSIANSTGSRRLDILMWSSLIKFYDSTGIHFGYFSSPTHAQCSSKVGHEVKECKRDYDLEMLLK